MDFEPFWNALAAETKAGLQLQWVLGYVTAYGSYGNDSFRKTDPDAMTGWIDNYCRANPLDNVEVAAQKLVEALKAKK